MPQSITLKPHLSTAELYRRYRTCPRPQEKARWRALHLISQGEQANRAARRVGAPRVGSHNLHAATTSVARKPCRTSGAIKERAASPISIRKPHANSTLPCARLPRTADCGQRQRSLLGLQSAPARRCMRRPHGVTCDASALRCKCHAPSIGGVPRLRSKPVSKKAQRHRR